MPGSPGPARRTDQRLNKNSCARAPGATASSAAWVHFVPSILPPPYPTYPATAKMIRHSVFVAGPRPRSGDLSTLLTTLLGPWPDDFQVIPRRERHNLVQVRRPCDFLKELLEARWGNDDQYLGRHRPRFRELVDGATGNEHKRASRHCGDPFSDQNVELPLEHVEGLFLRGVDMRGRPVAYYRVLDERIGAAGFFFGSLIGIRGA